VIGSSPLLAAYLLLFPTALAAGAGAMSGWATSYLVGTKTSKWIVNAALAGVSFIGALYGAFSLPWHGSFVSDGWTMNNQFPYPFVAAYTVSIALAILHEFYRSRRIANLR
jgi:hypothetical protein